MLKSCLVPLEATADSARGIEAESLDLIHDRPPRKGKFQENGGSVVYCSLFVMSYPFT